MTMAISLVASTRGLALMPAYAKNLLPRSVVSGPLEGEAPTIDLAVGYSKANTSPILKLFLSGLRNCGRRCPEKGIERLRTGINRADFPRSFGDRRCVVLAGSPALRISPAKKLHDLESVYRIGANALRRISVEGNGLIVQRSGGPERVWRPDAADEFSNVVDGVPPFPPIRNSAGLVKA
jgi:hypothetical protein